MEHNETRLRRAFRMLNRLMLLWWRLGLGWQMSNPWSGFILVLATTGRKSGARRLVPLNFALRGDVVYCLAGFGKTTHWLLNLQADPECEVWLPDGRRLTGTGTIVTAEHRRVALVREILMRSGFAAKLAEPGIDITSASDDVIAGLGPGPDRCYEVIEIQLGIPVTGTGGPGDLVWVWKVIGVTTVAAWLIRRRRRGAFQANTSPGTGGSTGLGVSAVRDSSVRVTCSARG